MKKTIYFFTFCFLFSAFCLNAQQHQLPDGSFETSWKWEPVGADGYWEYKTEFFYTLNMLYAIPPPLGPGELTAFRDNIYHQNGNYSIKLVSGIVPIKDPPIFLPGMVGTISENFVEEFLDDNNVNTTRIWDYDTPHALEGWYRYTSVQNDSAFIDIGFYNAKTPVFIGKESIKQSVSDWTHFTIEIPEEYWDEYFDYIRVLFVASAGVNFEDFDQCEGQKGSTLWIDNVSLRYTNGIKQNLFSTLTAKTFPNPATEVLHVELNEHFTGTITVYNSLGSKIMEQNISGTECQLNTSSFATGNYYYKLMNENTIFAQGKFVVSK